jgi:PAT family beta-lactamase induction signal transducer AmpG
MIAGQGALVVLAGTLEPKIGIPQSWSVTFFVIAGIFILLFIYHKFILPHPESDKSILSSNSKGILSEFTRTFVLFFKKKDICIILLFLLFYRFAEAQLVKLVSPFLLDPLEKGGLGLSTSEVGIVYGTVGIIALTIGGLLGGYVISKKGLRWWLWPMVIIMHAPDLMFVYLSQFQPTNFLLINIAVALEQFGYGFGFTAYAMYMIYISQGEYKTAHFAICTGIMALGMMLPGMISGKIQELIGYQHFFLWVMISTIPGFIVAALVKIPKDFGMKKAEN